MAEDVTPDVAEPIRGYRLWRTGGFSLFSTAMRDRWEAQPMYMATCLNRMTLGIRPPPLRRTPHITPHPDCHCGLYSWQKPAALVHYGRDALRLCTYEPKFICGAVDMWGHVEQHTWGYRAQYVRIAEFYAPPAHVVADGGYTLERIAGFYNAPLVNPPSTLATWWRQDCSCSVHRQRWSDLL